MTMVWATFNRAIWKNPPSTICFCFSVCHMTCSTSSWVAFLHALSSLNFPPPLPSMWWGRWLIHHRLFIPSPWVAFALDNQISNEMCPLGSMTALRNVKLNVRLPFPLALVVLLLTTLSTSHHPVSSYANMWQCVAAKLVKGTCRKQRGASNTL